MPNVVCPSCKATLSVTDEMLGGEVQCGQCQTVFRTATGDTKPGAPRRRYEEDEVEEERPKRSRSRRDEDDEDERPSRRPRRRYEEDEEEDRPRRRSRSRRYEDDYDDDYDRPRRGGSGTGMAVTSMILGIIAIATEVPATLVTATGSLLCCGLGSVFTWPPHVLGTALGITGLVLGVPAMKKTDGKGMAVTGVATSISALVLAVISIVLIAAGYAAWDRALKNLPVVPPPAPPPVFRGGR